MNGVLLHDVMIYLHERMMNDGHGGAGALLGRAISLWGILCFCLHCVGLVWVFENLGVLRVQVVDVSGFHSSLEIVWKVQIKSKKIEGADIGILSELSNFHSSHPNSIGNAWNKNNKCC